MIRRTTWVVLGFLALALVALYLLTSLPNAPLVSSVTPTATPQPALISGWKGAEISILSESLTTGKITRLVKAADGTWNNEGLGKIASGSAEQLISELLALQVVAAMPADSVLSSLSLDHPAQTITLQSTNGKQITLSIGAVTPTQVGYYVRVNNELPVIVDKGAVDTVIGLFDQAVPPTSTPTPGSTPTPTP